MKDAKKMYSIFLIALLCFSCNGSNDKPKQEDDDLLFVESGVLSDSITPVELGIRIVGEGSTQKNSSLIFTFIPETNEFKDLSYFQAVVIGDTLSTFFYGIKQKSVVIETNIDDFLEKKDTLNAEDQFLLEQAMLRGDVIVSKKVITIPENQNVTTCNPDGFEGFQLVLTNSIIEKWDLGCYNDKEAQNPTKTEYYRYGNDFEFYYKHLYQPEHSVPSVFVKTGNIDKEVYQFYYP